MLLLCNRIYEYCLCQTKNRKCLLYTYSQQGHTGVHSCPCTVNCPSCPQFKNSMCSSVINNPKHTRWTVCKVHRLLTVLASITALAAPRFTVEPSDVAVDIGSNVTLPCHAQGYPEPQITWRREDSSPLFNRPRTHGSISQSKGHLQITSKLF